ncbi:ArsR/SmtB family transcription factor [Leifsonia sp. A12D58]|uniref:ArsR/SmtB family transcription factor n=1 Tax=Leifsonia sp. A12D58 TaxID=3397674 RepID=UPI0039E042EF
MADIFDVVADSTRRDILHILLERYNQAGEAGGEISVSDIVSQLGLSQPTVSKHLKVLREAGLVGVREEGQHRFYHLDYSPLEAIEDWLIPFLSVDFDAETAAALAESDIGLKDEQRAFATAIGKAIADTSYQVTHVVKDATPRKWRKND